ncbi:MAG TPA: class I SAM-dependent methyltransferase [Ohtaekwangia sp.]|nr:class I SAM-dependent methyltransferase [Ohtaekwangia sp.]
MSGKLLNNFDAIARLYDTLSFLVFGNTLFKAQLQFLHVIPSGAKILMLGGGTGALLRKILKVCPDCTVWYIEASSAMIEIASKKNNSPVNVRFIHGTESDIPLQHRFDVVITNFYFDLFPTDKLGTIIKTISLSCSSEVRWLVTDFTDPKNLWQKLLLKIMYRFFRVVCKIEASTIPDWQGKMDVADFSPQHIKHFYHRFVVAAAYEKTHQITDV